MLGISADGFTVNPAAFAFFMSRRSDDDLHIAMVFAGNGFSRGRFVQQGNFADDEQRRQLVFPLAEEVVVFAGSVNRNGSVQGMADLLILTSALEDTRQIAAVRQQRIPASFQIGVQIFRMSFRPIRQENAFFLAGNLRHVLPNFFCREGQYG